MWFDLRPIATFAVLLIVFSGASYSAADKWKFEELEEDWGKHCSIFVDLGEVSFFGFHGAPQNAVEAMLKTEDDRYPAFFQLVVRSSDGKSTVMDGEMSDYFGYPTFDLKNESPVHILSPGGSAIVQLVGGPSFSVSLTGFAEASAAFSECLGN